MHLIHGLSLARFPLPPRDNEADHGHPSSNRSQSAERAQKLRSTDRRRWRTRTGPAPNSPNKANRANARAQKSNSGGAFPQTKPICQPRSRPSKRWSRRRQTDHQPAVARTRSGSAPETAAPKHAPQTTEKTTSCHANEIKSLLRDPALDASTWSKSPDLSRRRSRRRLVSSMPAGQAKPPRPPPGDRRGERRPTTPYPDGPRLSIRWNRSRCRLH